MDPDRERLLNHIRLTHKVLAQMVEIVAMLWEQVEATHPELSLTDDAMRLDKLIETIRRATMPPKEQN